jgi:hypothetical protein
MNRYKSQIDKQDLKISMLELKVANLERILLEYMVKQGYLEDGLNELEKSNTELLIFSRSTSDKTLDKLK